jgi:flagellar protein FliO/FliZ
VRRDNVEHLVMIGGPTDIVVESNIVRATPAPREVPAVRQPAVPEPLPRTIALPEAAVANVSSPPQQSEPATLPAAPRVPRLEPVAEEPPAAPLQPHAEPQPRAPRDTLAALADELSTKPAPAPRNRPPVTVRPPVTEPRPEPRAEPRISILQPTSGEAAAAADQSLADMAHQLEAALRKPAAKDRTDAREPRAPAPPRAAMPSEPAMPAQPAAPSPPAPPAPPLRTARAPEVKPPRADNKSAPPSKTLYDSLEQEMASLLGRPTAKN